MVPSTSAVYVTSSTSTASVPNVTLTAPSGSMADTASSADLLQLTSNVATVATPQTQPVVVQSDLAALLSQQGNVPAASNKHVLISPGLPTVAQRLIDHIKTGEYIDFNELPPARGLSKSVPSHLEGQVVVIQANELAASRKLIPNFETWWQCFALYAAIRIISQPSLAGDLMAYSYSIAAMAKRYPWPTWVLYDQSFREEAAWMPDKVWGKEDASLYARYFNGTLAEGAEAYCANCHTAEHSVAMCPHKPPQKRVRQDESKSQWDEPCRKFNFNDGKCTFGASCRLPHRCLACGGAHPVTRCFKLRGRNEPAKPHKGSRGQ